MKYGISTYLKSKIVIIEVPIVYNRSIQPVGISHDNVVTFIRNDRSSFFSYFILDITQIRDYVCDTQIPFKYMAHLETLVS